MHSRSLQSQDSPDLLQQHNSAAAESPPRVITRLVISNMQLVQILLMESSMDESFTIPSNHSFLAPLAPLDCSRPLPSRRVRAPPDMAGCSSGLSCLPMLEPSAAPGAEADAFTGDLFGSQPPLAPCSSPEPSSRSWVPVRVHGTVVGQRLMIGQIGQQT